MFSTVTRAPAEAMEEGTVGDPARVGVDAVVEDPARVGMDAVAQAEANAKVHVAGPLAHDEQEAEIARADLFADQA